MNILRILSKNNKKLQNRRYVPHTFYKGPDVKLATAIEFAWTIFSPSPIL